MKTMTLTASSYADLKPFEMLAKKVGLSVLMSDVKPSALGSRAAREKRPRFNARAEAAIAEGRAMLRGEAPAKWYNSLDDMLTDLDADD